MPVTNPPRVQDYDNAHLDLQTIEDVVNGGPSQTVTSRLGRNIRTLANVIQDLGTGGVGGIIDAPEDGKTYARLDGDWTEIAPGGISEAPQDGSLYARIDGEWQSFTPGGVSGDTPVVANYAALKAISAEDRSNGMTVFVSGRSSASDGGGGWFYFNSASSDTDNGGTILAPDAGTGRWIRIRDFGIFNVRWFGATGNGSTDDTTAVQAAVSAIATEGLAPGGVLYFPRGHYRLASTITMPAYSAVRGDGRTTTRIDFEDQVSGVGFSWPAGRFLCSITGMMIEATASHAISCGGVNHFRGQDLYIFEPGGDGIYIDGGSYMVVLDNVWVRDHGGYGFNIEGFVTSIVANACFASEGSNSGWRINDAIYCSFRNCATDTSTEYGFEVTNVTSIVFEACSGEANAKSLFRFRTSNTLASNVVGGTSGPYGYVKSVVMNGCFALSCATDAGTTTPSFIEASSSNSRAIDIVMNGCRDLVDAAFAIDGTPVYAGSGNIPANSITASGEVRIVDNGSEFDKAISQSGNAIVDIRNSRAVPTNGAHRIGSNYDYYIDGVLVQRTGSAGSTFRGSVTNSAAFNFLTTSTGGLASGIALKTSNPSSDSRDWGSFIGMYEAGDWALMQSAAAGGNPISGNVALTCDANRNLGIKTNNPIEALTVNGNICPATDNANSFGTSGNRATVVYATTNVINTSDGRDKRDIEDPTEAELRAVGRVLGQIKKFRWNDAYAEKGDQARVHFGVIAQDVAAAFEAEGLDPHRYAMFCEDLLWDWEQRSIGFIPVPDDDGNPTLDEEGQPIMQERFESVKVPRLDENGVQLTRMGIRYDQLYALAMSAMWQRLEAA